MRTVTDNGAFGWAKEGMSFKIEPTEKTRYRYGPKGEPIEDAMHKVFRSLNGGEAEYIGIIGREVTGVWFYVLPGRENTLGGMSTKVYATRREAIDNLSYRVLPGGLVRGEN